MPRAAAKAAVEKAGGSVTLIVKKVLAADEAKRKKTAAKRAKSRAEEGCAGGRMIAWPSLGRMLSTARALRVGSASASDGQWSSLAR